MNNLATILGILSISFAAHSAHLEIQKTYTEINSCWRSNPGCEFNAQEKSETKSVAIKEARRDSENTCAKNGGLINGGAILESSCRLSANREMGIPNTFECRATYKIDCDLSVGTKPDRISESEIKACNSKLSQMTKAHDVPKASQIRSACIVALEKNQIEELSGCLEEAFRYDRVAGWYALKYCDLALRKNMIFPFQNAMQIESHLNLESIYNKLTGAQ